LVERTCTLVTEPEGGDYSIRRIVKFGEPLLIPPIRPSWNSVPRVLMTPVLDTENPGG
jgi:hypothetical protein